MRHLSDAERRARLARRHGIAPAHRYPTVDAAAEAMTALHATEASTVYLSLAARVENASVDEIDFALYTERTLVKQLAMRRTLFAFPRRLLPAVWGSAAARAAHQQRTRVVKDLVSSGITTDADAWLDAAGGAVLARLGGGEVLSTRQLREQVPELQGWFTMAPGKRWGGDFPIAPRVLGLLGAEGRIVRANNTTGWHLNRHSWASAEGWLGEHPAPIEARDGYAELLRAWLWTFGPGTELDVVWWLGATKTAARQALADVEAVPVALDSGEAGWVLSDDVDPVDAVEPWAALLPVLDPTTMGWKERDFYLAPEHVATLFDTNGNAGTTAWWDGRIVGSWVQDEEGTVHVVLLEDVGSEARSALDKEADRLTAWLGGLRINNSYTSQQAKRS